MKAMILAAGFGTRMQPLTSKVPKPALSFFGRPLIVHTIDFLRESGINDIVINLHYFPEVIQDILGNGQDLGVKISYSLESEILGTGGGIKKVSEFFTDDFVVINSDFLVNFDLKDIIKKHKNSGSIASMVLRESSDMHNYGLIGVSDNDDIVKFTSLFGTDQCVERQGHFTGIHVFSPQIFSYLEKEHRESFCINRVLYPALYKDNRVIKGFFMNGSWEDIGTISEYYDMHMKHVIAYSGTGHSFLGDDVQVVPPVFIGSGCAIGKDSIIGPNVVLEKDVAVGTGCNISNTIITEESSVNDNTVLSDSIFYQGKALLQK